MAWLCIAMFVPMFFLSPAFAAKGPDYPHRDWGQIATLDMTLSDATTCTTQGISRMYERVLPVPVQNGVDIDAGIGGGTFGVAHDPYLRMKVREHDETVTLRVFYRHPISQKHVGRVVKQLEKQCLKVKAFSSLTDLSLPSQ